MTIKWLLLKPIIKCLLLTCLPLATQAANFSPYVGQHKQVIKGLSAKDIDQLKSGSGWGLAKAAELNGIPGPAHLLELQKQIPLSDSQIEKITLLHSQMQTKAITLGEQLIQLEQELESYFANKNISDIRLHDALTKIATVRKNLRYTHLSAHIKTLDILSAKQIQKYNRLRGYDSDPCKVPKGHDPLLWQQHNDC